MLPTKAATTVHTDQRGKNRRYRWQQNQTHNGLSSHYEPLQVDGLSTPELLEKLRLEQDGKLKRAAIVLFGKDLGKFYPNTFVKISKFEDDDFTIHFQEVEEGNIIQVLDKVLSTLDSRFLTRNISFEGMNRVETLEY